MPLLKSARTGLRQRLGRMASFHLPPPMLQRASAASAGFISHSPRFKEIMQIRQLFKSATSASEVSSRAARPRTLAVLFALAATLGGMSVASAHDAQPTPMSAQAMANAQAIAALPASNALEISDCWVRLLPAPVPSGAYLTIRNASAKDMVVQAAASPAFASVMLHDTTEKGGVSRMTMAGPITIHGHGTFKFAPGGYHVMLEKPTKQLTVGDTITLYLATAAHQQVKAACTLEPAATTRR